MEQGYQCPTCGKPLVFLSQYQYWHCQGCGGYYQYQQIPVIPQQPQRAHSKVLVWIGVSVVVLIIIMAVLWAVVFSDVLDTFDEMEKTETTPTGTLVFTESDQVPGRYQGNFVSISKAIELSDASITITDHSAGISKTQDPIASGLTIDTGAISAAYFDQNANDKMDGTDTITIEEADSDDIITFVFKPTGGVIARYTFT